MLLEEAWKACDVMMWQYDRYDYISKNKTILILSEFKFISWEFAS